MQPIPVPQYINDGIKILVSLKPDEFDALASAMKTVQTFTVKSLAVKTIREKTDSKFSESDLDRFTLAMSGLEMGRFSLGFSLDDFIDGTVAYLASSKEYDLGENKGAELRERLRILLSIPSLAVSGKALDLMTENERIMQDCRIITDMRPVFGDNRSTSPEAIVLVNTLLVEYSEGGERRQVFITVDSNDIRALRRACDDALAKEIALGSLASKANLPILEMAEPEAK